MPNPKGRLHTTIFPTIKSQISAFFSSDFMPNLTVGLGAAWAGCTVEQGLIRNFSSTTAHSNGGMVNFEMHVQCSGNDNSGAFRMPGCTEAVSLPYSCVSLNPTTTNPNYETTQNLTQAAGGKYCWGGGVDKRFWAWVGTEYSSYDACKQQCAEAFYQALYNGFDEESFDLIFPGYLG